MYVALFLVLMKKIIIAFLYSVIVIKNYLRKLCVCVCGRGGGEFQGTPLLSV